MKPGFLLVSVLVFLSLSLTVYSFDKDVVAVWMFDEGGGVVAKDATGNGHDGKINGAKWGKGKFGNALEFNGTSDLVEVPHDNALNLETYTIIATFQIPSPPTAWYTVICKDTGGPIRTYGMFVWGSAPNVGLLNCSFSTGNQWRGIYDPTVDPDLNTKVDDGKWHTAAITYDMKMYRVYVDGKLDAEKAITDKPDMADMTVTIGSWHGGGWFKGSIDEVYLSKRALSQAEIERFSSGVAAASAVNAQGKISGIWGQIKVNR